MRVVKLFFLSNEAQWRMGEVHHLLSRYQMEELSKAQIISSPEGHLIGMLDGSNINATARFVAGCRGEHGQLKTEVVKLQLKDLWRLEKALLKSIDNYPKLRIERILGDMRITEAAAVTYDLLGHTTLCSLRVIYRIGNLHGLTICRELRHSNQINKSERAGTGLLSRGTPPVQNI